MRYRESRRAITVGICRKQLSVRQCEDAIAVPPPSRVESCVGAQKGTVEASLKKA